jgi:hypothetical protein
VLGVDESGAHVVYLQFEVYIHANICNSKLKLCIVILIVTL